MLHLRVRWTLLGCYARSSYPGMCHCNSDSGGPHCPSSCHCCCRYQPQPQDPTSRSAPGQSNQPLPVLRLMHTRQATAQHGQGQHHDRLDQEHHPEEAVDGSGVTKRKQSGSAIGCGHPSVGLLVGFGLRQTPNSRQQAGRLQHVGATLWAAF